MKKLLTKSLSLLAAGTLAAAPAAVHAAGSPPETLSQLLAASGITESGYLAASYYDSSGDNTYHQFDTAHDSFQLDQAGLTLAYQPSQGFGALVDLIAGEDARTVNAAESASTVGSDDFDLLQGFIQYAHGPLTVEAGKFTTLAGAEGVAPTGNTNFSRSLLFYAEPMTHTGLRATVAIDSALSVIVGVNNGWNYTRVDAGSKTAELGIALTPIKPLSVTAQAYLGKDPVDLGERALLDTVWTYTVNPALSLIVSYDWGRQDASNVTRGGRWDGVAAYVNEQIGTRWRVSVRGEVLDDHDGFVLGTPQTAKEGTLTVGFDPAPAFELRIEGRYDTSSHATFTYTHLSAASGEPVTRYSAHQSELALQGVYKF